MAAVALRRAAFALLLACSFPPPPFAEGCGPLLHADVARRAALVCGASMARALGVDTRKGRQALAAGAPSPDWGYVCFGDHAIGEAMHWTPFLAQAARHIKAAYGTAPYPQDSHAARTLAFFAGVASHQIADVNWHGLDEAFPEFSTPTGHGFLRALGGVNYGCGGALCQRAHSAGDTAGEFVTARDTDFRSWLPSEDWWVPVADVVAVLRALLNVTVAPVRVEACAALFYAAQRAAADVAPAALSRYVDSYVANAPMLVARTGDWPLGGADDNAVWTVRRWAHLGAWVSGNATPPIGMRGAHATHTKAEARRLQRAASMTWRPLLNKVAALREAHGALRLTFRDGANGQHPPRTPSPVSTVRRRLVEAFAVDGEVPPFAHVGAAVAACVWSGNATVVAVGAPGAGAGAVHLQFADRVTKLELPPEEAHAGARFGSSVACISDGMLAVGSPSWGLSNVQGWDHQEYRGRVDIYDLRASSPLPWRTLVGATPFGGLGSALSARNGTLAIGAPTLDAGGLERGAAYAVTMEHLGAQPSTSVDISTVAAIVAKGTADYDQLGSSVAVLDARHLLVGAPGAANATGYVAAFDQKSGALWRTEGSTPRSEFGAALLALPDVVFVGAPAAKRSAGAVARLSVPDGAIVGWLAAPASLRAPARFGSSFAPDGSGGAFVGAPLAACASGPSCGALVSTRSLRVVSRGAHAARSRFGASASFSAAVRPRAVVVGAPDAGATQEGGAVAAPLAALA